MRFKRCFLLLGFPPDGSGVLFGTSHPVVIRRGKLRLRVVRVIVVIAEVLEACPFEEWEDCADA